jgi:hypothetical protein
MSTSYTNIIYALYAIPDDDFATVQAVSTNKEILQEIFDSQVPEEDTEIVNFEIAPIDIYLLAKIKEIKGNQEKANAFFKMFGTEKNLSLMKVQTINLETFKNKIFAFNKITTNDVKQCLVAVAHDADSDSNEYKEHLEFVKTQKLFKNDISFKAIDFDVYYDEGIINA